MTHPRWPRVLQLLLTLSLPVVMLAVDIRVVTGHWFTHREYAQADFPPDPYGLTAAERTRLADVCVDYLATTAPLSLLADLRLPSGDQAFNARELRHMADVQAVFRRLMAAGTLAALLWAVGSAALLAAGERRRLAAALLGGGGLILGLLLASGAIMLTDWWRFFTGFHRLFFEGETWIFPPSDTLIRLFPVQFWMDVALIVVLLAAVEGVVSVAGGLRLRR